MTWKETWSKSGIHVGVNIYSVSNVYELQGTLRDLSKAAPEAGQSPSLNQTGEVRNLSTVNIMYEHG